MSSDVQVRPAGPAGGSTTRGPHAGPTSGTEAVLAEVLAGVVEAERVSVDSHFFDDLGADSLVMARFCARVRKRPELPSVSMRDVYEYPTIRGLAAAIGVPVADTLGSATTLRNLAVPPAPVAPTPVAPTPVAPTPRGSTVRYLLCGVAQFLILIAYSYPFALVMVAGYEWISTSVGLAQTYQRAVVFGAASFVGACLLPALLKWLLVGRWKPRQIRVWSLGYLRFWLVKTVIRTSPLVLFVGTPLYLLHLRLLGAKIGRGVVIFTPSVPVCTDLFSVGEGSVIRKDSLISCYRAHAGVIETGAVRLGRDVLVGEATVLDIGTSIGDGAQLGHASSLHTGQAVPAGESWHGSPARRTDVDHRRIPSTGGGTARRVLYPAFQLLTMLALWVPLAFGGLTLLLTKVPQLTKLVADQPVAFTGWVFYRDALVVSTALYFGALVLGLLLLAIVPRVLNLLLRPDRDYPLYGIRFWAHRAISRRTNVQGFMNIFGDSSYVTGYLRWIGYDLGRVEQTGSNFGTRVKHENPFLSSVGSGTMVADGLSLMNTEYSSTSFRLSRVTVGPRNFLGNHIVYPAGGRTGDNCLLGTKVMVPLDGRTREGVGLLGSPSFEIPRSVERDTRLAPESAERQRRQLRAKNRHNLVTIAAHLLTRWVLIFAITVLAGIAADLYAVFGPAVLVGFGLATMVVSVGYWILVERSVRGLQALVPMGCSIYDRAFWRHERYWKVPAQRYMMAFNGTPMKNLIWRALGVRIGRRVFDDGAHFSERMFVTIGDDATLNAGSGVQCHSQEDGAFKSDHSVLGARVTLGVGAFVHYGVTIEDDVVLAPDTFVMKGEEIPAASRWCGNPARDEQTAARPARPIQLPAGAPGGVLALAGSVRGAGSGNGAPDPGALADDGATPDSGRAAASIQPGRSAVERWQAIPVMPVRAPNTGPDPDRALAYRNLAELVHRSAMLETKLDANARQLDAYARQARKAGRRGAAVALLAAACVLVLTAGALIGTGPMTSAWRSIAGLVPIASAAAGPADAPGEDGTAGDAAVAPVEAPEAEFLRDYFATLPGDTAAAYQQLTPQFQVKLGGLTGFTRLYQDLASAQIVDDPVVVDADTVTATIRFQRKGGLVSTERWEYTLKTATDGKLTLADWLALS